MNELQSHHVLVSFVAYYCCHFYCLARVLCFFHFGCFKRFVISNVDCSDRYVCVVAKNSDPISNGENVIENLLKWSTFLCLHDFFTVDSWVLFFFCWTPVYRIGGKLKSIKTHMGILSLINDSAMFKSHSIVVGTFHRLIVNLTICMAFIITMIVHFSFIVYCMQSQALIYKCWH